VIPLSVWDPVKRCRVLNPKAFEPTEEDMATHKTILATDAPWPNKVQPKPKVVRKPRPPNSTSKIANTNKNFERWANNLGIKNVK
jgi:hypothetical protein